MLFRSLHPHGVVHAYANDDAEAVPTAIYQRTQLCAGDVIQGPAIVTQLDATTVIPSDWVATVTAVGTLIITRQMPD